jgi:hypothetical protein
MMQNRRQRQAIESAGQQEQTTDAEKPTLPVASRTKAIIASWAIHALPYIIAFFVLAAYEGIAPEPIKISSIIGRFYGSESKSALYEQIEALQLKMRAEEQAKQDEAVKAQNRINEYKNTLDLQLQKQFADYKNTLDLQLQSEVARVKEEAVAHYQEKLQTAIETLKNSFSLALQQQNSELDRRKQAALAEQKALLDIANAKEQEAMKQRNSAAMFKGILETSPMWGSVAQGMGGDGVVKGANARADVLDREAADLRRRAQQAIDNVSAYASPQGVLRGSGTSQQWGGAPNPYIPPSPQQPPALVAPQNTSRAFQDGAQDRNAWERWFSGLSGEYQRGAEWWSSVRSEDGKSCPDARGNGSRDFVKGCLDAKKFLDRSDARRKKEPNYKIGWNSGA